LGRVSHSGGRQRSFASAYQRTAATLEESFNFKYRPGVTALSDARSIGLPDGSAAVCFTDPPYYDAIPYASLSDFFLVWLKRIPALATRMKDPLDPQNPLSNKIQELIVDEVQIVDGKPKGRSYFEDGVAAAFAECRRVLSDHGVGSVVFAHKTTEGWEALLTGLIRAGWLISASWPLATEMAHRPRARESAALATSVHLICRPRPHDAEVGDWHNVLRELPKRVADWMEHLQGEGIRGADLVFACIGPALEIFSRYRKVETADGQEVKLDAYLQKVWEVVGRIALERVLGSAESGVRDGIEGVLEEDARLTALFLWTLQSTTGQNEVGERSEDEDETTADDEEEEDSSRAGTKGYN